MIPGYSGETRISFYKTGLRLVFERGKLTIAEPWQPDGANGGDASFPNLTFLQVVFGHRSLDELAHSYADCRWNDDGVRILLNSLFPRCHSQVMAIG